MGGRTETFNQRVVKVVAPTLEAKEAWREAAERDGFKGMSGWIRALIANNEADRVAHLEEQAAEAQELRDRVRELEEDALGAGELAVGAE